VIVSLSDMLTNWLIGHWSSVSKLMTALCCVCVSGLQQQRVQMEHRCHSHQVMISALSLKSVS